MHVHLTCSIFVLSVSIQGYSILVSFFLASLWTDHRRSINSTNINHYGPSGKFNNASILSATRIYLRVMFTVWPQLAHRRWFSGPSAVIMTHVTLCSKEFNVISRVTWHLTINVLAVGDVFAFNLAVCWWWLALAFQFCVQEQTFFSDSFLYMTIHFILFFPLNFFLPRYLPG